MNRAIVTFSFAAAAAAVLLTVPQRPTHWQLSAAPEPPADRWVPLDISAHMNHDVIQTPNEWLRCWDLYRQDVLRGDEDDDLGSNPLEGKYPVRNVFGQHGMGAWTSFSYHICGAYPYFPGRDVTGLRWHERGDGQGLPADGRIGRYRLYMDELESPQWYAADVGRQDPVGRNAVRLTRFREDTHIELTLPPSQQGRYKAVNLLFAAEIVFGRNFVRISARYGDGSETRLFEGRLNDFFGPQTFQDDRRNLVDNPPQGQGVVIKYTPMACGYLSPGWRDQRNGRATMSEFAEPLRLDAAKVLEAVVLETVYQDADGRQLSAESWAVDIFAASALAVP